MSTENSLEQNIIDAIKFDNIDVLKSLIKEDTLEKTTKLADETPLILAAMFNRYAMVEFLIAKGANVNASSREGWHPVILAAENDNIEMVKLLMRSGCHIESHTVSGKDALDFAMENENHDMINLLNSDYQKCHLEQIKLEKLMSDEQKINNLSSIFARETPSFRAVR